MKEIPILNNNKYKPRRCLAKALEFLESDDNKVVAFYGLRRTGKTTLMKQLGAKLGVEKIYQVLEGETMRDVYAKLDECFERKEKLVLVDEITNASDFIENGALLADYYASCGMNVVIAGTDSLGIFLAENKALLDRIEPIDTTYVSFAEHCEVLNTNDMDDYLKHGGLMSKAKAKEMLEDPVQLKRYLDSAVSDNIAHSLRNAKQSKDFPEVTRYNERDISLVIRKTVELYNGTITCNFLNSDLQKASITAPVSDAIKKAANVEEKKRFASLDKDALTSEYKAAVNLSCSLEKDATDELIVQLTDALFKLNFLSVFENREYNQINGIWLATKRLEYYIVQPAIKNALLQEAKRVLLNSDSLANLTEGQREWLSNQIESDILGQMTEAVVIFETAKCLSKDRYLVCKPMFRIEGRPIGEYDMLVYDKKTNEYYGFEIKHSSEMHSEIKNGVHVGQDKNLHNAEIKGVIDTNYGNRKHVCVLYNGASGSAPTGTDYLNISDFLVKLDETRDIGETIGIVSGLSNSTPSYDTEASGDYDDR